MKKMFYFVTLWVLIVSCVVLVMIGSMMQRWGLGLSSRIGAIYSQCWMID